MRALEEKLRAFDGPATARLARSTPIPGLGQLPDSRTPRSIQRSVCGWCSTGCGLLIHQGHGKPVNITPDPLYPVNRGTACPKGWEAMSPALTNERGTTPLLRDPKTGAMRPIGWGEAMRIFKEKTQGALADHGPEGAAFLSTGQIPTEEMLFLGALWKFGIGAHAADSNTRQCMATAHVAYKESFGFDAPPFSYQDLDESDALVFVGANPAIAHPILWERVVNRTRKADIAVIDPRRTETAQVATRHLALDPKTDLVLFQHLAREVIARNWIDRDFVENHTSGFEELQRVLSGLEGRDPLVDCGLAPGDFEWLVERFRPGLRTSVWWTMGVNQGHQAVRTAQAIVNLCLITGNIGKPGTGPNSITGQMNAMGSRMFSCTTSLPCGRDWKNPAHRKDVADILGVDVAQFPAGPGPAYDQILTNAREGRMGMLWVVATNPAHSWIGQKDFLEAASKTFLVVQDMYPDTETAKLADLYLPSGGWGEKDGTAINSERRLGRFRASTPPPGSALVDFDIFRLIARTFGVGGRMAAWHQQEDVFQAMRDLSRGRPNDITGVVDLDDVEGRGGVQWPAPEGGSERGGTARLFADGVFPTPDGRARIVAEQALPSPHRREARFPLRLLTGRGSSSQWHTLTRSNRSALLRSLSPARTLVEMHPDDASVRGLRSGDQVRVVSANGEAAAVVHLASTMRPGEVFLPMHAPDVNRLTVPVFDAQSRQPSYKDGWVEILVGKSPVGERGT